MAARQVAEPGISKGYNLEDAYLDENIIAIGYGNLDADQPLELLQFARPQPDGTEVMVKIMYTGVCHSDWHVILNEWNNSTYPCIPGHEIVGTVIGTGVGVTKFKKGDIVMIGTHVDSCGYCKPCSEHLEQYCENIATETYNSQERLDEDIKPTGPNTYGGYSNIITVKEHFVHLMPEELDPSRCAPLLCAGMTTYSALKQMEVGQGTKVGIAGIGGLGHLAVKYANAMGAEVIALTTTPWKVQDSLNMGASDAVLVTNSLDMARYTGKLDSILCTIPVEHNIESYLKLLKRGGLMWIVGAIIPLTINFRTVMLHNLRIGASNVGSPDEVEEMLEFSARHNIEPDVELIDISKINETVVGIKGKEVQYRYVIDLTEFGN